MGDVTVEIRAALKGCALQGGALQGGCWLLWLTYVALIRDVAVARRNNEIGGGFFLLRLTQPARKKRLTPFHPSNRRR